MAVRKQGTGNGPLFAPEGMTLKRPASALILFALSMALLSCSWGSKPVAANQDVTASSAGPAGSAEVWPPTFTPVPSSAAVVRPTATFVPLVTPSPTPEILRIGVDEALAKADAGEAIMVDVRAPGEYKRLRVAEAISIPQYQVADRSDELPADRLLIFYCD
jgi:hypothetical protein